MHGIVVSDYFGTENQTVHACRRVVKMANVRRANLLYQFNPNSKMYIIIIAWLYVVVLMAATESNLTAAIMTLLFFGLLPSALLFWLFGGVGRARRTAKHRLNQRPKELTVDAIDESVADQKMDQQDRANTKTD